MTISSSVSYINNLLEGFSWAGISGQSYGPIH